MTEAAYVELPILGWLCGELRAGVPPGGLGWTYRDEATMAAFDRPLEDPLVEKLLIEAVLRINAEVKTEAQAKLVVATLRLGTNLELLAMPKIKTPRSTIGHVLTTTPTKGAPSGPFIIMESRNDTPNL
jgi:hypothetical protein